MNQLQQIIDKAGKLFLTIGIKSVSMDDLSRRLGISKKTLYQCIDNKSDLVKKICQNHVRRDQEMVCDISANAENAIDEMLKISKYVVAQLRDVSPTTLFDLQKYYPESWDVLHQYHNSYVYEHIVDNIERGKKEELYHKDVNTDIIAKSYVAQTLMLVNENLFPLKDYRREELFSQFMTYHIRGIAGPKGIEILGQLLSKKE